MHVLVEKNRRAKNRVPVHHLGVLPQAHGPAWTGFVCCGRHRGRRTQATVDYNLHGIAGTSSFAVVGHLKIARCLDESECIQNVVELVDGVESLGFRRPIKGLWCFHYSSQYSMAHQSSGGKSVPRKAQCRSPESRTEWLLRFN